MPSTFTIALAAMAGLAVLGLPIGHAMITGSILYLLLAGLDLSIAAEQLMQGLFRSYVLLAVPLFILAADLMNAGSLSDRLLQFCSALVGRFRGGLGHVNIIANVIFAGMSGSAIADAVGLGRVISMMMMREGRYTPGYAAALTAAAAVIGPIIPPSIPMVLYALVSDTSIGFLFLGGVGPGLLIGIGLAIMNSAIARRRNFPVEPPVPLRALPGLTVRAFPTLLLPAILLVGIYGGVTTPTEAAAVAAAYALLISTALYRAISPRQFYGAILASARSTASIGMLIAAALAFNYVVTIENIPGALRIWLGQFQLSANEYLIVVNVVLLILGCLLEGSTILLVIVPILIPTAAALGVDMVHFGVVVVVNIMIGLVTPPYGLLLFVAVKITGAPFRVIVAEMVPFLVAMIAALAIITFVPGVVLWLPRLLGYQG
jgi:tripartite ATP-independent transporter DctM subunit